MTIVQTQNPGNSFITIRGISQARNSDMPVAVVVDGVLMTNPAQFNQQLFDIQQIEVLKGPQGALYGRNAIGGAITSSRSRRRDKFESKIRVGADSGPGYMAQGAISGPLERATWKYRASLSYSDTDGFLENTYSEPPKADPYKDSPGRVRFTWEPSDKRDGRLPLLLLGDRHDRALLRDQRRLRVRAAGLNGVNVSPDADSTIRATRACRSA